MPLCAIVLALSITAAADPPPGPYITVYHDDAVAFQFRRDRIHTIGERTYNVWLRWLWAEVRSWKGQDETARVVVAEVDCDCLRVRELIALHKDRTGFIFDVEEMPDAPWRTLDANSGAGAAIARTCKFIPEVLGNAPADETED